MAEQFPHGYLCPCPDCCAEREYEQHIEERAREMQEQYDRDLCIARIQDAVLEELTTEQLSELATLVNQMEAENHKARQTDEPNTFNDDEIPF